MSQDQELEKTDNQPLTSPKKDVVSPFKAFLTPNKPSGEIGSALGKAFKPLKFSATKLIENVLNYKESVMRIVLNNKRTDGEAWSLYDYLKEFRFFQEVVNPDNFETDAIIQVCKKLTYEKYKAGTPIFVQGDASNGKVYILLSGELLVLVKKLDSYAEKNMQAALLDSQEVKEEDEEDEDEESELDKSRDHSNSASKKDSRRPSGLSTSDHVLEDRSINSLIQSKQNSDANSPRNMLFKEVLNAHRNDRRRSIKKSDSSESSTPRSQNEDEAKTLRSFPSAPTPTNLEDNKSIFQFKRPRFQKRTTTAFDASAPKFQKLIQKIPKVPETLEKRLEKQYGFVKDKITERGSYFGEKALETDQKRGATIYPVNEVELLVLTKDVFNSLKSIYDKEKKSLMDFIFDYIPAIDQIHSKEVIESLLYLFGKGSYEIGHHVCNEGDISDSIFIVYQGTCNIYKTIVIEEPDNFQDKFSRAKQLFAKPRSTKEKLLLAEVGKGTFIGEEILFKAKAPYRYSVQVTSKDAKILEIKQAMLKLRFPADTFAHMKDFYLQKQHGKDRKLNDLISLRGLDLVTNLDQIPVVTKRKEPSSLLLRSNKINMKIEPYQSLKFLAPVHDDSSLKEKEMPVALKLPEIGSRRDQIDQSPLKLPEPRRRNESPEKEKEKPNDISLNYIKSYSRYYFKPSPKELLPSQFENKSMYTPDILDDLKSPQNTNKGFKSPKATVHLTSHEEQENQVKASLDGYYDKMERKFEYAAQFQYEKQMVNDINYFKLDFGLESAIEKKNKAERLKIARNKTDRENYLTHRGHSILGSLKSNRSLNGLLSHIKIASADIPYSLSSIRQETVFMTEPNHSERYEPSIASKYDTPARENFDMDGSVMKSSPSGKMTNSVSTTSNKYSDKQNIKNIIMKSKKEFKPLPIENGDGSWIKVDRRNISSLISNKSTTSVSVENFYYLGTNIKTEPDLKPNLKMKKVISLK